MPSPETHPLRVAWRAADIAVACAGAYLSRVKGQTWPNPAPRPSLIPAAEEAYTAALERLRDAAATARAAGLR